jgi:hypothetical protein
MLEPAGPRRVSDMHGPTDTAAGYHGGPMALRNLILGSLKLLEPKERRPETKELLLLLLAE